MRHKQKNPGHRVTVTLAPGQRSELEELADRNDTTLAFMVRYALRVFLDQVRDRQISFDFHLSPPREGQRQPQDGE